MPSGAKPGLRAAHLEVRRTWPGTQPLSPALFEGPCLSVCTGAQATLDASGRVFPCLLSRLSPMAAP